MNNYRKIYQEVNGPIPLDSDGRSMEIHHIDGVHSNNDISNLKLVTIQEHYDIHYSQKDWYACFIMSKRMTLSPEKISELARNTNITRVNNGTHHFLGSDLNKKRVDNGTHNFLDGVISRKTQNKKIADGSHHFLDGKISKISNQKRVSDGTHHLLGGELQRKRVADGTHHFITDHPVKKLISNGSHHFQTNNPCFIKKTMCKLW